MRILLLTMYFAPDPAANANIVTALAEELVALGHEVHVVASFPHYEHNEILPEYQGKLIEHTKEGPIDIRRVYVHTGYDKKSIFGRLLQYASFGALSTYAALRAPSYDVILTPSPPLTIGVTAYLASRLRRVPYIYNVQDIWPEVAVRLGLMTNPKVIRFFEWMERFVYQKAKAVSVISQGFFNNLHDKGVPSEKLAIIPNFVDVDFITPQAKANHFSKAHGLDEKFVLLYAGNVGYSQSLDTVLDAAANLRDYRDIVFLIVGNGTAKAGLEQRAVELQLENVRFLPFQPKEDLSAMMATADVSLVPLKSSISANSVPSKVLTIMASGRPVLASIDADSDVTLLLNEARCGLAVTPDDPKALSEAILQLYAKPERRVEMGRNGRDYVEKHFTPKTIAAQYDELLRRCVGNHPRTVTNARLGRTA